MTGYGDLRTEGLFAELDGADAARRVESALPRLGAADWIIGSAVSDPKLPGRVGIEVLPPAGGPALGVSEGWDLAHALARLSGAEVEPMFCGDVPIAEGARFAEEAFPNDESCPEDVRWHLEALHAEKALLRVSPPTSKIVIAHLDTGYANHPELFGADPVVADSLGENLLESELRPVDPLHTGALKQPGHGTATASVMAARHGTRVRRAGAQNDVDLLGVAPFATVAPYRVTESVVVLGWQRRLARAIERATDAGHPIISMSLGGLGGSRLARALREADEKGVIVIAAAGNYVPFVVAPACYDTVVAVAASGPDGAPWKWSSRGAAVGITAPGHMVWAAGFENGSPVARPGSGTSFSTACVAGAAALWLCAHASVLGARNATLPRRFRAALACAGGKKLPSGFGAGVLDVVALLDAPTEAAPTTEPLREAHEAFLTHMRAAALSKQLARELAFHEQVVAATDRPAHSTTAEALLQRADSGHRVLASSALRAALRGDGQDRPAAPAAVEVTSARAAAGARSSSRRVEIRLRITLRAEGK